MVSAGFLVFLKQDVIMKKILTYILISAHLLVTLIGVGIIIYNHNLEDIYIKEIEVEAGGVAYDVMEVRRLHLSPSESQDYKAIIRCGVGGTFDFVMNFEEIYDGGMKEHVTVVVTANEKTVYEGNLSDLLEQRTVEFEYKIEHNGSLEIKADYLIPESEGNDTRGTSTQFDVNINIYGR